MKVLDFGLAKALARASGSPGSGEVGNSPTVTSPAMTMPGVILGTAAYMAPEQAKGKPADRRADIWALGCVLFEMLTAQRAFAGNTLADVLVSVIEHEPDLETLPARTPAAIRRLLHRCLEKDPKQRLDSAAVARIEIDEAVREPTPLARAAGARRGSPWRPIGWAAIGAGIAVLLAMMPVGRARPSELSGAVVATSVLVNGPLGMGGSGVHFAVEPSGRAVVFPSEYGGRRILYRRDLDQVDPRPLVGTDGGSNVFFSDDGRQVGFDTRSELWTAALDGGTPPEVVRQPTPAPRNLGRKAAESSSVASAQGCGWFPPPAASLVS